MQEWFVQNITISVTYPTKTNCERKKDYLTMTLENKYFWDIFRGKINEERDIEITQVIKINI